MSASILSIDPTDKKGTPNPGSPSPDAANPRYAEIASSRALI